MNERRDQAGVEHELQIDEPRPAEHRGQRDCVDRAERVREADEKEERIDGNRSGGNQLKGNRETKQQAADDQPGRVQLKESTAALAFSHGRFPCVTG